MDENKIKEVLTEASKSKISDNWDSIEAKISQDNQDSNTSKPIPLGRKRRKNMARIAIAATFFLVLGGIGLYDMLLKPNTAGSGHGQGFLLEAYADTNDEPTEITKDKDATISLSSSNITVTSFSVDAKTKEITDENTEYILILKPGGENYKSHKIKSVKNGVETATDGTLDSNGMSIDISNNEYSVTIDSPDGDIQDIVGRVDITTSDSGDTFDSNTFAISSDGTKTVTVIIEVHYIDGTSEDFTLTLTPIERADDIEMEGSDEPFLKDIKWIDFEISLK